MKLYSVAFFTLLMIMGTQTDSCNDVSNAPAESASGVAQVSTPVTKGSDGLTVEQRNVRDRLLMDNKPGSIKHLYVISAFSGQVIFYSTVRGKVTSSGKRLTPNSVAAGCAYQEGCWGTDAQIGSSGYKTGEVLEDDGTYGSSVEYVYWWDVQGRYHQLYVTGGMILTVSDQPIPVKSITINMEEAK